MREKRITRCRGRRAAAVGPAGKHARKCLKRSVQDEVCACAGGACFPSAGAAPGVGKMGCPSRRRRGRCVPRCAGARRDLYVCEIGGRGPHFGPMAAGGKTRTAYAVVGWRWGSLEGPAACVPELSPPLFGYRVLSFNCGHRSKSSSHPRLDSFLPQEGDAGDSQSEGTLLGATTVELKHITAQRTCATAGLQSHPV